MQIELTAEQKFLLQPLLSQINVDNPNGYASLIAQVYPDGLVLKLLTHAETKNIQKHLGCVNLESKYSTLAERNSIMPITSKSVAKRIAVHPIK